jgi:glycosyl transferase family 25
MSVTTAVRVISLESAVARRESFSRDAKDAGIDWEFFPAYTGLTPPLRYNQRDTVRRFGRPLSAEEIGCYVSHYKAWEWLAQSPYDQAFIFEDDVFIDWPAINELAKHNFTDIGLDLFRLLVPHAFESKTAIHRFLSLNSHMLRGTALVLGAAGYLLTRRGAALLVKGNDVIRSPSDWVLARYWEHGLPAYVLFPFPILEKFVPSTIGNSRANILYHATVSDRVARFRWRIRDRAMRAWVERFQLNKNRFGKTLDIGESFLQKLEKGSNGGRPHTAAS